MRGVIMAVILPRQDPSEDGGFETCPTASRQSREAYPW
jgi:hypothetical protein